MKKYNNRYLPIIGIVLILIGYFYLTYETFQLSEKHDLLKREITQSENEIIKLESIKHQLTADIKVADSIKKIQNSIILQSADPKTVKEGIELNRKINNPQSGYFTENKGRANQESAAHFEAEGYRYLFDRDVENAIKSFIKSENSFNGYHQIYEISKYLKANQTSLADKNSPFWKTAYREIASKFSWKMPEEFRKKLMDLSK